MRCPVNVEEVGIFLHTVKELIDELYMRRERLRDFATQLNMGYSEGLYLTFKAEFITLVVMLRGLCLGCVDFKNDDKSKARAEVFKFEKEEGYSLRNALVLANGRQHWQDLLKHLNEMLDTGDTLLVAMKRFANSFVCHYDPKDFSFERLYGEITKGNCFYSPLEGLILKVKSVFDAATNHYMNQCVVEL